MRGSSVDNDVAQTTTCSKARVGKGDDARAEQTCGRKNDNNNNGERKKRITKRAGSSALRRHSHQARPSERGATVSEQVNRKSHGRKPQR